MSAKRKAAAATAAVLDGAPDAKRRKVPTTVSESLWRRCALEMERNEVMRRGVERSLAAPCARAPHELHLNLTKNLTLRLLLHVTLCGCPVIMLTHLFPIPIELMMKTNMVYQGGRTADSREYYRGGTRIHGSDQGSARQTVTNAPARAELQECKVLIQASHKLIATNFLKLPDKVCSEVLIHPSIATR